MCGAVRSPRMRSMLMELLILAGPALAAVAAVVMADLPNDGAAARHRERLA